MSALNQLNVGNNSDNMFRATKLWNQVLHSFYIGITLKKRRRHMRTHYNCFVAQEAVDWILIYLQMSPHFAGQQISRLQSINLLRKYLKTNVIERVDARKANQEFQDNKDLYRFTRHANENLPFLSSLNLNPNQLVLVSASKLSKSDHQFNQMPKLINELSLTEKSDVFKQIFFNKLVSFVPNVDDFIRRDDIISLNLMQNMTRVGANGVVQLTDKNQDLPHWVVSAIKCLANWPKASGSGSCLPKYPGFENDVFAVVKDYFVNIGIPLIPNQLYSLVIHLFDRFSNQTIVSFNHNLNQLNANLNPNQLPVLTTLANLKPQMSSIDKQMKTSTPILETANQMTAELPPNCVFETLFMSDRPVTRIVSIDELSDLFANSPRLKSSNSFGQKCSSNKSLSNNRSEHRVTEKRRYVDAITTIPRTGRRVEDNYKSPITSSIYKTKYESPDSSTSSGNNSRLCYYNFGFAMQSPAEDGEYMLSKSVSSLSSIHLTPNRPNDPKDNLSAQFSKSTNNCSEKPNSNTFVNSNERRLLEALQLSLLLMPASNRRHLHLLLRLLSRIIHNKQINLGFNQNISTKHFILKTFSRSILCAQREHNYDEMKAQKVVTILVDNCKDIFKVPQNLIEEINRFLVEKAKQKLFVDNSHNIPQYCQQISSEEFEIQRDVMSEYALADLLKSIMSDDRLSDRDKLKWIKQFKLYHPEVYDLYFTNQMKVPKESRNKNSKKPIRSQNSNLLKRFLSIRL